MDDFIINEDGSLTYLQRCPKYDTTKNEYGTLKYKAAEGKSKKHKKKRLKFDEISDGETINAFIHSYREVGLPIRDKDLKKYLPNVDINLREYFQRKVAEHNEYIYSRNGKSIISICRDIQ